MPPWAVSAGGAFALLAVSPDGHDFMENEACAARPLTRAGTSVETVEEGAMVDWVAIAAVLVTGTVAVMQILASKRQAEISQELKVAHEGAQAAMTWRQQVWALHDRGLDAEEIRWIMYAESGGEGYERENGIIDEVVRNVPRIAPVGLEQLQHDSQRRIPRPSGGQRLGDGKKALPATRR